MKNIIKTLAVILFAATFIVAKAQKHDDFTKRICKEWKLVAYEEEDELYPPAPEHTNDKIIFTADNKMISVEKEIRIEGTWIYSAKEKKIMITTTTGNTPKRVYELEIKKLTDKELIVEYEDEELDSVVMHFTSDK